jgi:hypothetical protein
LENGSPKARVTPDDIAEELGGSQRDRTFKFTAFCTRTGIKYPKMAPRVSRGKHLGVSYTLSTDHHFHDYHLRSVTDPQGPFQDAVLDTYEAQHAKETLWLHVLNLGVKGKTVVKTHATKRVKHAFADGLELIGYDKHGKPFKNPRHLDVPRENPLYGTVRVNITNLETCNNANYAEMVKFWADQLSAPETWKKLDAAGRRQVQGAAREGEGGLSSHEETPNGSAAKEERPDQQRQPRKLRDSGEESRPAPPASSELAEQRPIEARNRHPRAGGLSRKNSWI